MSRGLAKIFDSVLIGAAYLAGAIIILMMLSISYEVVMRYFFNAPTIWVIDFAGYMQQALVLLGAAWVLKTGSHTRVDIFLNRFSSRTQKIINLFTASLGLAACVLFLWKGLEATLGAYQRGDFLYREVKVPSAPLLAFFPLAFLLLSIQFCRDIFNYWRSL